MFLLLLLIFSEYFFISSTLVGARGEEDLVLIQRNERNIAVLDPLFPHYLGFDNLDTVRAMSSISEVDLQRNLHNNWGFLRDFEHRLNSSCESDCLDFSVIPWHVHGSYWAAALVYHPAKNDQKIDVFVYTPAVSANEEEYTSLNENVVKLIDLHVRFIWGRLRNLPPQSMRVQSHVLQSKYMGLIPSLETTKMIVLVKIALRIFQVGLFENFFLFVA